MGYSNYWGKSGKVNEAEYADALKDIAKIVKSQSSILADGTGDEGTKPDFTNGIAFNGIGEQSHETFSLPKTSSQLDDNDFCKTNKKPYDDVVVAALARLSEVSGIKVSSDGGAGEWEHGVALASKILGRDVKNPLKMADKKVANETPRNPNTPYANQRGNIPESAKPSHLRLVKSFVNRVTAQSMYMDKIEAHLNKYNK